MRIIVSQKGKKLIIAFENKRVVDNYVIDKADEFLVSLDRFLKKRKMDITVLSPFGGSPVGGKKAGLEFV